MTYDIQLRAVPLRVAAVVRFRASAADIPARMPSAFGEVIAYLARSGGHPDGPAIARYSPAEDAFEVEAGFYVANTMQPANGVTCIELGGCDALVTTHFGPYEQLTNAYEALKASARERHRELADSMWEEYWSDAQSTPEPEWRTDVVWPLKPAL